MDALKAANLGLRFVLELCALAAFAYWGLQHAVWVAIVTPLAAAALWGVFVSPKAPRRAPEPARFGLEIVFFLGGAAALAASGQLPLAAALAAAFVVNRALIAAWDQ